MSELIKNWKELATLPPSKTHKIEVKEYNGWLIEIETDKKVYLSTHTFYGSQHKWSTALFQSCGFDIEIDNCDKE